MGSPVETCTMTWTVHNFSVLGSLIGDTIKSPGFKSQDSAEYEWNLEMFPMGEEEADYVVLYLIVSSAAVNMKYILSLRDANNREIRSTYKEVEEYNTSDKYRVGSLKLERKLLLQELKNDILKIHAKAAVYRHFKSSSKRYRSFLSDSGPLHFYTTKAVTAKGQYSWIVDFNKEPNDTISETFACSSSPNTYRWCLLLKEITDDRRTKIILRLLIINNSTPVSAQYSICIKNNEDVILWQCKENYAFPKISFKEFDLGERKILLKLLRDGILLIRVKIVVVVYTCSNLLTVSDHTLPDLKLTSDFQQTLLFDEKFADVQLIVGEQRLPAHRAILAARSPVFLNMLKSCDPEKVINGIEIRDFPIQTVKSLLKFIYTGIFEDILIEDVVKVLCIANQYEVEDLKCLCENFLVHEINTYNAVYILFYAKKCSAENLEVKAMQFITSDVDCYPPLIDLLNVVDSVRCCEVDDDFQT